MVGWRAGRGLGAGGGGRVAGGRGGLGGRRGRTANRFLGADGQCEGECARAWGRPAVCHVRFCLCIGGDCLGCSLFFRPSSLRPRVKGRNAHTPDKKTWNSCQLRYSRT